MRQFNGWENEGQRDRSDPAFIVTCVRDLGFACGGCRHDRLELHFDPVSLWDRLRSVILSIRSVIRNCRPGAEYFPSLSLPFDHAYFFNCATAATRSRNGASHPPSTHTGAITMIKTICLAIAAVAM